LRLYQGEFLRGRLKIYGDEDCDFEETENEILRRGRLRFNGDKDWNFAETKTDIFRRRGLRF